MDTRNEVLDKIEAYIDDAINFDLETYDREVLDQIYDLFQPVEPQEPKENYPVIAIEDIDAETVKRWYQYLVGKNEIDMKHDIHAMARASTLNKHLNWEQPKKIFQTSEEYYRNR